MTARRLSSIHVSPIQLSSCSFSIMSNNNAVIRVHRRPIKKFVFDFLEFERVTPEEEYMESQHKKKSSPKTRFFFLQ